MNFGAIVRRIRRCESEVPAQLVLEYAIREAVAAEREACAKACEEHQDGLNMLGGAFATCAAAIRARSNDKLSRPPTPQAEGGRLERLVRFHFRYATVQGGVR